MGPRQSWNLLASPIRLGTPDARHSSRRVRRAPRVFALRHVALRDVSPTPRAGAARQFRHPRRGRRRAPRRRGRARVRPSLRARRGASPPRDDDAPCAPEVDARGRVSCACAGCARWKSYLDGALGPPWPAHPQYEVFVREHVRALAAYLRRRARELLDPATATPLVVLEVGAGDGRLARHLTEAVRDMDAADLTVVSPTVVLFAVDDHSSYAAASATAPSTPRAFEPRGAWRRRAGRHRERRDPNRRDGSYSRCRAVLLATHGRGLDRRDAREGERARVRVGGGDGRRDMRRTVGHVGIARGFEPGRRIRGRGRGRRGRGFAFRAGHRVRTRAGAVRGGRVRARRAPGGEPGRLSNRRAVVGGSAVADRLVPSHRGDAPGAPGAARGPTRDSLALGGSRSPSGGVTMTRRAEPHETKCR